MATKSENADIAVLQTQMSNVESAVQRIESKLDSHANTYVSSEVFTLKHDEIQKDILAIKTDIIALQNKKSLINWLTPSLSAVLASVMTFLIINAIGG